ncbi:MAG TPA: FAD-dependent oxidoreductase, partial [Dehalococcoidia bacterium]|nr:FAD-dependent oxidoreductase [Dehalococcoidia bacterium]
QVTIRQKQNFVTSECTRCDECVQVCPVILPNEFDVGMAARKAIYSPFPQAVPGAYVVDIDNCLNELPNYIPCNRCVEACLPHCIDFGLPLEKTVQREVGSIVLAAGYDLMDAALMREYGYGTHPDILTSMELERLLISSGPTGGEIVCPSDGRHPHNMLIILCVGSRDRRFYKYCSRFCCMYSIKHAFQAMDHGVEDVTVLYMDVRAYGKGFDAFFERTRGAGARFIRGRPSQVHVNSRGLEVRYEDTETGRLERWAGDLVVLASAVRPPDGIGKLAEALGVEIGEDGFIQALESQGGLIVTTRPGIYAAGCATGPKDIPDSVAEASAAAACALNHLTARFWPEPEEVEPITDLVEPRVGVFVCHCGTNIASVVDVDQVVAFARTLPGVVHAQSQMFSCAGNTQEEIVQVVREKGINRMVVAACSPKTHEPTFRRVCTKAGLNPFLLDMVNLRNQDSWVHKQSPAEATGKAADLVWMGVQKARLLQPLYPSHQPVTQKALVIGGGIAGMSAAASLARQGYETHLVEKEPELGGILRHLEDISPAGLKAQEFVANLKRQVEETGVKLHLGTEVEHAGGFVGNFYARLTDGEEVQAGAVVLAMGARPYVPTEFNYGQDPRVITNLELEERLPGVQGQRVTFIGCVGSRRDSTGCSRYCCESMMGQALKLRQQGNKVRVLYRDIRTFSRQAEELYEAAGRAGVQFLRYEPDSPPETVLHYEDGAVAFRDELLAAPVKVPTDLLVLVVGLQPPQEDVSQQLKVGKSEDGFLLERHPKLGPVEAGSAGIYLAGAVQAPKDVREAIAQGFAAAAKASIILAKDNIEKEPITAQLVTDKCIVCGICVPACPFGAIEIIGKVKQGEMLFI